MSKCFLLTRSGVLSLSMAALLAFSSMSPVFAAEDAISWDPTPAAESYPDISGSDLFSEISTDEMMAAAPVAPVAPVVAPEQKMTIIWDEPLPQVAAEKPVEKSAEKKVEKKTAVQSAKKPSAKALPVKPSVKEPMKEPVKAAAPVAAMAAPPVPVRKEIASIEQIAPPITTTPERGGKDERLLNSLLNKISLLEHEKESLRRKLLQVDAGKLQPVYQCSAEANQIREMQAQVEVLTRENEALKKKHKTMMALPPLPPLPKAAEEGR